ncbi:MAG: site-specific integrase [Pseudomonadota bacterium]
MGYRPTEPDLRTIEARQALELRRHPYFSALPGLRNAHLGFRKMRGHTNRSASGTWLLRYRLDSRYRTESFAQADDKQIPANGNTILSFRQAEIEASLLYSKTTTNLEPSATQRCSEETYTVGQCVADFLDRLEYEGKPIDDPLWRIRTHIEPKLKHRICSKLTADELIAWRDSLAEEPPRRRTSAINRKPDFRSVDMRDSDVLRKRRASVNRTLCVLRAALNYAFDSDILSSDLAWQKLHGFKGVENTQVKFLAHADIKPLLAACESDFRALVQAALFTGCYYGELIQLRSSDIDLSRGTLQLSKDQANTPREVALTEQGKAFFEDQCTKKNNEGLLFQRADGQAWGTGHQTRRMRQACKAAGLSQPINFTELRHTYAAHLILQGVPIAAIAANLGHSDTRMCERHFGHLVNDDQVRIIQSQSQHWLSFDSDVSSNNLMGW